MNKLNLGLYAGFFVVGFLCAYGYFHSSQIVGYTPVHSINSSMVSILRNINSNTTVVTLHGIYYDSDSQCTGSMKPLNDCGNTPLIKLLSPEDTINIGDVIGFRYGNSTTDYRRHQVIGYSAASCYITKGLNNVFPDTFCVPRNQITEKMIGNIYT